MSSEGFIAGAVIVAIAIVLGAWLMSTTGYDRCMALHDGNVEGCQRSYMPTATPTPAATPTPGGASR